MKLKFTSRSERAEMERSGYRVAIVGVTGAVGAVMLEKLQASQLSISEIVGFASERSIGREIDGIGPIQTLSASAIEGFDLALFSAGGEISGTWAPQFVSAGAIVIDNSSRWRADPTVPLVVSEVNPQALSHHQGLIANPNCAAMPLAVVLKPIIDSVGVERVIVSTYQSTSGTGVKGVKELEEQTHSLLHGRETTNPAVYPHRIGFNIIAAAGNFPAGSDYTDEEQKLIFETRKILGDENLPITVTCVRVPVISCHSEAVNIQTRNKISPDELRSLLKNYPGIIVIDDPTTHSYPTPELAKGHDETFVGRIRADESHPRALNLWLVADNLYKGAATNAIQIAERLHSAELVGRT